MKCSNYGTLVVMEGFTVNWVDGEEITLTIGSNSFLNHLLIILDIVNPFSELSAGMTFRIQITDQKNMRTWAIKENIDVSTNLKTVKSKYIFWFYLFS